MSIVDKLADILFEYPDCKVKINNKRMTMLDLRCYKYFEIDEPKTCQYKFS